jgi:branched-chain amino acid transport system permease protein
VKPVADSDDPARKSAQSARRHPAAGRDELRALAERHLYPHRIGTRFSSIAGFGVFVALITRLNTSNYATGVINQMIIYAIIGVGFYLVLGLSGQFAFSQAAMFGLGAYVSAWGSRYVGFWLSTLLAVAVVAVLAAVFSLILSRASDLYFAIATLGLSQIIVIAVREWTAFSGPGGEVPVAKVPNVFGWVANTPQRYFWLFLVLLLIALTLTSLIDLSSLRRDTIAVRDRSQVAAGLGMSVVGNRLTIYVVGSAYAAVAGSLFAHSQGFIAPDTFGVDVGIDLFLLVILGGMRSVWGPILGSIFVVGVPEVSRSFVQYRDLVFSLVLVAVVLLVPQGFVGLISQGRDFVLKMLRRGRRA